jgi:hypothetical protein
MAESFVDTHVHFAANWRDGQGGLPNSWLASEGKEFDRDWTEIDLLESASAAVPGAMVFVECSNEPPLAEAKVGVGVVECGRTRKRGGKRGEEEHWQALCSDLVPSRMLLPDPPTLTPRHTYALTHVHAHKLTHPPLTHPLPHSLTHTTASTYIVPPPPIVASPIGSLLVSMQWALDMANDPASLVKAVIAHIPVPDGAAAVEAFLAALASLASASVASEAKESSGSSGDALDTASGASGAGPAVTAVTAGAADLREESGEGEVMPPQPQLPAALRGGRVVLLGDPMPPPDACRAPAYLAGLGALSKAGLLWEWCCVPAAIPYIAACCREFPDMTFVLDHLGHNNGRWREGHGRCVTLRLW